MQIMLECGDLLLDVRSTAEYEKSHLDRSVNVPLVGLRNYVKELDKGQTIVVISDHQAISEAAAFLLLSYKFSAKVLKGDITQVLLDGTVKAEQTVSADAIIGADKLQIKIRPAPKKEESLPELLAAENANLREQLKELKLRAEKAEQEYQELTQKYQLLLKHSERLKAMLTQLKTNGKEA
jgi:rhodanese-related sulfurtransferase